MKRIMVVIGGGRKHGNTEQLADAFIRGAQEAGHWVDKILLREMRINGCTGCNACRYQRPCVQRDDFNALVPLLHSCAGLAAVFLDFVFINKSLYRAILQPCRGGSPSAFGAL